MSTCKGRKNGGKFCGEQINEDNVYCEQHSYLHNYFSFIGSAIFANFNISK